MSVTVPKHLRDIGGKGLAAIFAAASETHDFDAKPGSIEEARKYFQGQGFLRLIQEGRICYKEGPNSFSALVNANSLTVNIITEQSPENRAARDAVLQARINRAYPIKPERKSDSYASPATRA